MIDSDDPFMGYGSAEAYGYAILSGDPGLAWIPLLIG